jgi:hypothetical protein
MWTLAVGYHEDRTPTHGYEATREAAVGHSPRVLRTKLGTLDEEH